MEIITPRLRLRPARAADAGPMHAVLSDRRAMRYWATLPHVALSETEAWVRAMIGIPRGAGEDFIIEHNDAVIGKAGFYRFPEIGFILHSGQWGRGFAQEALIPVLDRAFAVHGLPAVIADVDPRNGGSLGLLFRLGFRETGRRPRTLRLGGEWCDSVDLILSPSDWKGGAVAVNRRGPDQA